MANRLSRRHVLGQTIAAVTVAFAAKVDRDARAGSLALTPECRDHGELTLASVEGPFFEPHSPERTDLVEPDGSGQVVMLEGRVLTPSCAAVSHALVDLWHADENGVYDMTGYRYRGHVYAGEDGYFRFRTIKPALYPGRTRHFHIKVQAPGGRILTTQLFFPGEPRNRVDSLYRDALLLSVQETPAALQARFNFVVGG
jgi:protocatechuate 3,4-dioxygenase beta subunit